MSSNQNPILRVPRISEMIAVQAQGREAGSIAVNPEGGLFEKRNLGAALRNISSGKRILLGEGEHACPEITRTTTIHATSSRAILQGPIRIKSPRVILEGLEIMAPKGGKALMIEGGQVYLDNCTIKGGITVRKGGQLFLRNCLVSGGDDALMAHEQAQVEMHATRVTNCRIGIALRENASGAFYHCRIDHCLSKDESDPGAGIYSEGSNVYTEAVTFSDNGAGIFLKDCRDVRLICTHFYAQQAAAIISNGGPEGHLKMRSCIVEKQTSVRSPQVTVMGGRLVLAHGAIRRTSGLALATTQARLEVSNARLESGQEAALDIRQCEVAIRDLICESTEAAGLEAVQSRGLIQTSSFAGVPPTRLENCPELSFSNCELQDGHPGSPVSTGLPTTPETPHFIKNLSATIYQDSVRIEMERLLRLAHASRQRELGGRPMHEQSFHVAFAGAPGTGKLAAAKILAEGLCTFGIIARPEVEELSLSNLSNFSLNGQTAEESEKIEKGVLFLRTQDATGVVAEVREVQLAIEKIVQMPRLVIILDGDREQLRTLLRLSPVLERAFRHLLYFPEYGPRELMTIFTQLCRKDHIKLSPDAAICGLLLFHVYCDRKDKLFNTAVGVEDIYHDTRENYLERCSRLGRFDLDLEKEDLPLPQDRTLQKAMERSASFVSFCPACSKENPWIPGLEEKMVCLHCEHVYSAEWGLWSDSVSYRRVKESFSGTKTGLPMRRMLRGTLP